MQTKCDSVRVKMDRKDGSWRWIAKMLLSIFPLYFGTGCNIRSLCCTMGGIYIRNILWYSLAVGRLTLESHTRQRLKGDFRRYGPGWKCYISGIKSQLFFREDECGSFKGLADLAQNGVPEILVLRGSSISVTFRLQAHIRVLKYYL